MIHVKRAFVIGYPIKHSRSPLIHGHWLERHGIAAGPVVPRYGAEGEGPSIYVSDPEGNVVELKGPPWAAVDAQPPRSQR